MLIGSTGHSVSGFAHIHLEIRDEPGGYEKYAVNPFGRMPYQGVDDYDIEILQVSVDPTAPTAATTVLLTLTGPRQELDLNRFGVVVGQGERVLDFNDLNRTRTPAPNDTVPDVLDNPYQDGVCMMPGRFNTSSEVYQLDLAFHRMPGVSPAVVTAWASDLFSHTITTKALSLGELLLTPSVVTATTPAGRWVSHTHTLTNASSVARFYTLTARSAQSWTVTITPPTVALAAGESITFTSNISVPDNGYVLPGAVDCVLLQVSPLQTYLYLPLVLRH